LLFVFVWIRATIPRIRYDRLMNFGWKVVIPWGLVWILATGAIVILPEQIGRETLFRVVAIGAGIALLLSLAGPLLMKGVRGDREVAG
ncbi:MAG TPA: NADH-quinone oxidoreductase subunit H, partial [Solirubrobacterales bacterium]|nr:NADH-quinone oxidoreductase subunit H [Solirubrobacterales bacterium]